MGIFRHMQGDNHDRAAENHDQNQFPNPNPNPNPNQANGHRCNQIWVGNTRLGLYYVNGSGNLNLNGFGTAEKLRHWIKSDTGCLQKLQLDLDVWMESCLFQNGIPKIGSFRFYAKQLQMILANLNNLFSGNGFALFG